MPTSTIKTPELTPVPGAPVEGTVLETDVVFGSRLPNVLPPPPARVDNSPRAAQSLQRRRAWDDLAAESGFRLSNGDADEVFTAQQMLERGDLDWDASIEPTYRYKGRGKDRKMVKADEHAVVRLDNDEQLGTVGKRYKVFQNREVFEFGDNLVGEGKGKWVATGQQGKGAKVFMVMELNDPFTVLGDEHKMFICFRTSHNGLSALRADLTPIRMFCFNQNALITKTARSSFSLTHTTNHDLQQEEAQQAFSLAADYERAYADLAAKLLSVEITPERATTLLTVSMIKRAKVGTVIQDAHASWLHSNTVNDSQRMTGWGLLNGVTEYFDHYLRRDNPNAQFEAVMTGENNRVRNALAQNILKLAA